MQCTPKKSNVTSQKFFRRCRWSSIFLLLQRFVTDENSDYFLILGRGALMRCSRWPGSTASNISTAPHHTCIFEKQTANHDLFIALLLPPCHDRWSLEPKRTHQARPRNNNLSLQVSTWHRILHPILLIDITGKIQLTRTVDRRYRFPSYGR